MQDYLGDLDVLVKHIETSTVTLRWTQRNSRIMRVIAVDWRLSTFNNIYSFTNNFST